MKKLLCLLLLSFVCILSTQAQLKLLTVNGTTLDTATFMAPYSAAINGKQPIGAYLLANQTITVAGDMTGSGTTSITAVLATVNSNVGTFGTASSVAAVTGNGKGLLTAISSIPILITESQVTSLTSDLASKQGTLSLTVTGSGAATLVGSVLNVPTPAGSVNFKSNEELTGAATASYTLANTPIAATLKVFKNGVKLVLAQFSLTGAVVTLTSARLAGDIFSNDYNY